MTHDKPNSPGPGLIRPDWPAPLPVKAATTTRHFPGPEPRSAGAFDLATTGLDAAAASANRRYLREALALPNEPAWLEQVHGRRVVRVEPGVAGTPRADAAWTDAPGTVCAVLTADCLPVLLCDTAGRTVAAVHGGWRGLQQGIIAATIDAMKTPVSHLMAWLGPAIGAAAYEVDDRVRDAFGGWDVDSAFQATRPGHWRLDLYAIARSQLNRAGVEAVYGGDYCTFNQPGLFFSYRREKQTGRMASLIWIAPEND